MTKNLDELNQAITEIQTRNKRVELDKAWETSWTRKCLIAVITYLLIVIFMFIAELEKPFVGAIIPAVAYLLSMSTIPFFKKIWIKKNQN
ncbi:hypothetical protein JW758_00555 [Candidatus Peregrinibacteria bacterium]|nr:hypothetical protein [Candidatus Peregrinibacteria bacterium]